MSYELRTVGLESGMDGDDIIAWQLGATEYSKLSQKQQEYVDKIKAKLQDVSQNLISYLRLIFSTFEWHFWF